MKNVLNIARRQFASYFNGPIAYIAAALLLIVVGFYFWTYFFLQGRASLGQMFSGLNLALIFIAPALSMGIIAEEKRSGTIELLLTMPVRESEVIIGKYLGVLALYGVILLLTLAHPIAVSTLGDLDWGPVVTGYFGIFLEGGAMLAIGLMASSWTSHQLIAFFVSFFILGILAFLVPEMLRPFLAGGWAIAADTISFNTHLSNMARGVIDMRDVVYFFSLIAIGLMVSFRALESRRWS